MVVLRLLQEMNPNLTFITVVRNEELNVRRILDIAKELCKDIVVAVQKSEDKTLQICREYPAIILERPVESPEDSRDAVMELVKTPWAFLFDADEVPSIGLIHFLEDFDPSKYPQADGWKFDRINYINGQHIEANESREWQFRLIRADVRWDTAKQGQQIHILPLVKNEMFYANGVIYHHRTLDKVIRMTDRWNELCPKTIGVCNRYLSKVKEALNNV